jgi:hypothetical protein
MKILCKLFGHKTKKETDIIIRISGFADDFHKHQLSETRYHPDTFEPVEKPEDWASYSIKIGLTVETRDEIKFNQMWDDWNNALTLEQVFERYKEMNGKALMLVQGYYNWIYLQKPSMDEILDRMERDRATLIKK